MKKVALVFLLAVFVPSLVLAWLAVRSLRDQQFILERQQSLLYQGVADALAREAGNYLADRQHEFSQQVETLLADRKSKDVVYSFDDRIRSNWPIAEVGFVVNLNGDILCPTPPACAPAAAVFYADNAKFLGNREIAEVFWNAGNLNNGNFKSADAGQQFTPGQQVAVIAQTQQGQANIVPEPQEPPPQKQESLNDNSLKSSFAGKTKQSRKIVPQQQPSPNADPNDSGQYSKVASSEAEFRQLIGDSTEGTVARFLENKLNVLIWYRSPSDPKLVFGTKISLPKLKDGLKEIVNHLDPTLAEESREIVTALLDDNARPVALSHPNFQTNWKHPFVATEIGEALPHWEVAVYLLNPERLSQSARTLKLTLGLLIAVLVLAIGVGSWLIVTDLNRQLTLARQKTDFVSNVSHELKTPLTSIRMFSELLAEGRVLEVAKQRSYLNIISAEAARLTRLINNVLDFSRMERGEKKYNKQPFELVGLVRETAETYRPHLESNGFKLECELPEAAIPVEGDRDALAQVMVNLLSNAEKYSNEQKEIVVQVERRNEPLPHVEVRVLDRGPGVPRGCEERIFEQFYRAHDSLSSGIQGSGLGLTLARQIARAHGGDVIYQMRAEGGSCFILRLPAVTQT